jgi:hypothetical protein
MSLMESCTSAPDRTRTTRDATEQIRSEVIQTIRHPVEEEEEEEEEEVLTVIRSVAPWRRKRRRRY